MEGKGTESDVLALSHGMNDLTVEGSVLEDANLFVGDLADDVNENDLSELFSLYGKVLSTSVKREKSTNAPLGYGFVQMTNPDDAERARIAMNKKKELNGRVMRIGWAQRNSNLFVGGLCKTVTSEILRDMFRGFGAISDEDTFVKECKDKSLNYGFVRFKKRSDAEKAKHIMQGKTSGQSTAQLRIGWGEVNVRRSCVHVRFNEAEGVYLSIEDLKDTFEEFGSVVAINFPSIGGVRQGYGFINFEPSEEGEAAASRAITCLDNTVVKGVTLRCNYGRRGMNKARASRKARMETNALSKAATMANAKFNGYPFGSAFSMNMSSQNQYGFPQLQHYQQSPYLYHPGQQAAGSSTIPSSKQAQSQVPRYVQYPRVNNVPVNSAHYGQYYGVSNTSGVSQGPPANSSEVMNQPVLFMVPNSLPQYYN
eukprot:GCRY01000634.1.p1 GENE.GCRY01000634.1~~GCRY01000634.1.p1  ORF type:complete len:425 (-),score=62.13 GCRY01000634.1:459-1733(-)